MSGHDEERIEQEIAECRNKILSLIGAGSMGHIYRVTDADLGTKVVIKFPAATDDFQSI